MRPDCGKAHGKSGRANIPNGGVPYGGTCSQRERCEYDCDFMYAKNDAVPFLTCTFTEKWIYFESRDAYFEENEVDFTTLCSCKYKSGHDSSVISIKYIGSLEFDKIIFIKRYK